MLRDGKIEAALYAFVFLELQGCPLSLVEELLHGLLQVLEDAGVGALYLAVVDVDFCL